MLHRKVSMLHRKERWLHRISKNKAPLESKRAYRLPERARLMLLEKRMSLRLIRYKCFVEKALGDFDMWIVSIKIHRLARIRQLFFAMADLCTHTTFFATNFSTTFSSFLRTHLADSPLDLC